MNRQEHNLQAYSTIELRMAQGIREERESPFPKAIEDSDVATENPRLSLIPLVATDSIVYSCLCHYSYVDSFPT